LSRSQLCHICSFKKGTECVISEDSFIKAFGSSPNGSLSTDKIIEFINYVILQK
jgi:hypothetical protein